VEQGVRHSGTLFAILAVSLALLPVSTDLYLASLPGLARYFGVPVAGAQATLSAFLVGFALSQLVFGPISDRWGRRPTLIAGAAVYFGASLVCALAPSIDVLVAGRFLQGVGACSGTVIARAVVRDVYGPEGAARALGYLATAVSMFPLFGPVLGGVIESWIGWRWNIAVLASIGLILLVATIARFPETNVHRDEHATRFAPMLANYGFLLRDRRYVGYVVCLAGTYSGLFAFISGSSFVLIEVLGQSPAAFGVWFGGTVAGYLAGSWFTARTVRRLGSARMMRVGTLVIALAGSVMLALAVAGVRTPLAIVAPMAVYLFAGGMTMPNSMAGALAAYPKMAGAASSLMGLAQMLVAAAVGILVGKAFDGTPVPMAAAVCVMSWLVLATYFGVVRPVEANRRRA
jgi:DHA1 family bicyclomycin/chloramphenicol resistance-like MFS transporter